MIKFTTVFLFLSSSCDIFTFAASGSSSPPSLNVRPRQWRIPLDDPIGSRVASITVTDFDPSDNITFTVEAAKNFQPGVMKTFLDGSTYFEIIPGVVKRSKTTSEHSATVRLSKKLNFQPGDQLSLSITANDGLFPIRSVIMVITEPPLHSGTPPVIPKTSTTTSTVTPETSTSDVLSNSTTVVGSNDSTSSQSNIKIVGKGMEEIIKDDMEKEEMSSSSHSKYIWSVIALFILGPVIAVGIWFTRHKLKSRKDSHSKHIGRSSSHLFKYNSNNNSNGITSVKNGDSAHHYEGSSSDDVEHGFTEIELSPVPETKNIPLEKNSATPKSSKVNAFLSSARNSLSDLKHSLDINDNKLNTSLNGDSVKHSNSQNITKNDSNSFDKWEFPRHQLKIIKLLGEGCFGQVWKYDAHNLSTFLQKQRHDKDSDLGSVDEFNQFQEEDDLLLENDSGVISVAVKTVRHSATDREKRELLNELEVMKGLRPHPNIVRLLASCTDKDPVLIVMQLVDGGTLQEYLRKSRSENHYRNLHSNSQTLSARDLVSFAFQIAKGMSYLSSMKIVHRDLAARNILLDKQCRKCKIVDFGFARDLVDSNVYERKSGGRLPLRWMAPESLYDNCYTTKSDVWSFGVLFWEIVALGATPYPGKSASQVMEYVASGGRLEKPPHCDRQLYNIMSYCWTHDPESRPSFPELVDDFQNLLIHGTDYIDLNSYPDHVYYNQVSSLSDEQT